MKRAMPPNRKWYSLGVHRFDPVPLHQPWSLRVDSLQTRRRESHVEHRKSEGRKGKLVTWLNHTFLNDLERNRLLENLGFRDSDKRILGFIFVETNRKIGIAKTVTNRIVHDRSPSPKLILYNNSKFILLCCSRMERCKDIFFGREQGCSVAPVPNHRTGCTLAMSMLGSYIDNTEREEAGGPLPLL